MKQVINSALRTVLAPKREPEDRYAVTPHRANLAPGLDLAGFNKLADDLEVAIEVARRNPS